MMMAAPLPAETVGPTPLKIDPCKRELGPGSRFSELSGRNQEVATPVCYRG